MISFRKNSIATKISIAMLIVILAQTFILGSTILSSNVIDTLEDNAYQAFTEKVKNARNTAESEMKLNFSNIIGYTYDIIEIHNLMDHKGYSMSPEEASEFLIRSVPILVSMLRSIFSTGSFILLDNDGINDEYTVIYLKDTNPKFNDEDDNDIFMTRGPENALQQKYQYNSNIWKDKISLNEKNQGILTVPIESKKHQKIDILSSFGHWQVSNGITSESDELILTYSFPLTCKNGKTFGVVGVEVSKKSFYDMLQNDESIDNSLPKYFLASYDENTGEIIPMLIDGAYQNMIINIGVPLELEVQNKKRQIYKILNTGTDASVLCTIQNLNLHGHETTIQHEQWVLVGLIEKEKLLGYKINFLNTLYFSFLASIILGIIMVYFMGMKLVRPIILLAEKVQEDNSSGIVPFFKTGYLEIDNLSAAIEEANEKILNEVLKTDKIINMLDLPLGTFEHRKGTDIVLCSPRLLSLLNIPGTKKIRATVDSQLFFQKIEEIEGKVEDENDKIYMLRENPSQWIKLIYTEYENSVLGIAMDVTGEVLDRHALKYERDYDTLTKLFNRFAFERNVKKLFLDRIDKVSAFVIFDLDNLKYINDVYSHDMGDIYISLAAKVLAENLKEGCILGRISGDEFHVFLYGFETEAAIREQLNTVYSSFHHNQLLLPNGNNFKIRVSGGLAWYGKDSCDLEELIRFADFAMYQGKNTSKGEIKEFDRDTFMNDFFMLSGKEELNKILDNQLIEYAFQPIISAKTGELYGYESLMRPQSDILNSPIKLLQIATMQSQLSQIEKITFFKTLALYKKYEDLFNGCKIFINSSPNHLLTSSDCLELVSLYPNVLQNVVLEIIENEKLDDQSLTKKRKLVKEWGGLIALDDYGSGYNGDISLLNLLPEIVKIDRLIIQDIETDKNRQSIVHKLIAYAKERNIFIVAEGIETSSQLNYLVRAGVDFLQGYYISRPGFIPDFNNEAIAKEIKSIHK